MLSLIELSRNVFPLVEFSRNAFFNRTQSKRVSSVELCRKDLPRSNSIETFPLVELSQNVFPLVEFSRIVFHRLNLVKFCQNAFFNRTQSKRLSFGRIQSHCFSSVELGQTLPKCFLKSNSVETCFIGQNLSKSSSSVKFSRNVSLVKLSRNAFFNRTQSKRVSSVELCRKDLPRSNSIETFPLVELSQNVFPLVEFSRIVFHRLNLVKFCQNAFFNRTQSKRLSFGRIQSHCFSSVELGQTLPKCVLKSNSVETCFIGQNLSKSSSSVKFSRNVFFGGTQSKRVSFGRIQSHCFSSVELDQTLSKCFLKSNSVETCFIGRTLLKSSSSVKLSRNVSLVKLSRNVFFWSNSVNTCFLGRTQSHCFSSVERGQTLPKCFPKSNSVETCFIGRTLSKRSSSVKFSRNVSFGGTQSKRVSFGRIQSHCFSSVELGQTLSKCFL